MAPITIRQAVEPDIEELVRLRVEFLAEVNRNRDVALLAELYAGNRTYLREKLPAGEFLGWVAEVDGQIVGTSGLVLFRRPPSVNSLTGWEGLIINMYTLPDWRGRGIARRLLETLMEYARTTPMQRLWLHATESGRPLYAKLGFQPSGDSMELDLGR